MEALFGSDEWGGPGEEPRVAQVWEAIETVLSRAELELVNENVRRQHAGPGRRRAELPGRYQTVSALDSRSYGQRQGAPRFVRSYRARCL